MCPACTGLWFNRVEYAAYRAHQREHEAQAHTPPLTQKLTETFLLMNDIQTDRERVKQAEHAFARESFVSLISFLSTHSKNPLALAPSVLLPILTLLQKLADQSTDQQLFADMEVFEYMLRDITRNRDTSATA